MWDSGYDARPHTRPLRRDEDRVEEGQGRRSLPEATDNSTGAERNGTRRRTAHVKQLVLSIDLWAAEFLPGQEDLKAHNRRTSILGAAMGNVPPSRCVALFAAMADLGIDIDLAWDMRIRAAQRRPRQTSMEARPSAGLRRRFLLADDAGGETTSPQGQLPARRERPKVSRLRPEKVS